MATLSCFKSKFKPKSLVLGLVSLLDSSLTPAELIQENKSRDCLLDQFSHSHNPHLEEYQRPPRPEASAPVLSLLHHKDLLVHGKMNSNTVLLSLTAHAHEVLHPVSISCPEGRSCSPTSAEDSEPSSSEAWLGRSSKILSAPWPRCGRQPTTLFFCVSIQFHLEHGHSSRRGVSY